MLVLTRKIQESIRIGDSIKVTILRVKGNTVRVGIEAPEAVRIVRSELSDFGSPKATSGGNDAAEAPNFGSEMTIVEEEVELPAAPRLRRYMTANTDQASPVDLPLTAPQDQVFGSEATALPPR